MARDRRPAPASARPNDWRVYRPAIWLAMLGIAVALLVTPAYLCAVPLGGALGIGIKIRRGRTGRLRR